MAKQCSSAGFFRRNRHIAYILPWLIGFLVFRAVPMLYALVCGFTDMHLFRGISETGLMQYRAIAADPAVRRSLLLTVEFAAVSVPLRLALALLIAALLAKRFRGVRVFRTACYLPSILGGSVAAAVLWKAMFRDNGVVNSLLRQMHLPAVSWLSEPHAAFWTVVLLRVWEFGSPMLLFLAALEQIPQDLTDAARLDGAGALRIFFCIKLPMISPVLFYNAMLGFCSALQEFSAPFIITGGGPRGGTTFLSLLLYRSAFTANEMGYASALAWVLFLLSAGFSALFLLAGRRLLYYADEGGGT